jgi:multidrug efflux pump subunit AcrA (membrane-fusion protein)
MEIRERAIDEAQGDRDQTDGMAQSEPRTSHGRFGWTHRLRRPYMILPIAMVLAIGVWWVALRSDGSSATAAAATQQLATVTKGPISNTVSAEGTITAAQTANLSFPSSGTVTAVNVKAGDTVTAGQMLATVDSAQLASSVGSAQSNVATALAKLSDDETAGASSDQITADQTNLASANDSFTNAQQALAGASLAATFDGTVSQVNVTVGEKLSSSGTGGTAATGTGTGSGQSSSSLGSGTGSGGGGQGAGAAGGGSGSSAASSSPAVQVVSKGQYTVSLAVGSSDIDRVAAGQSATVTVTTSSSSGGRFGGFGGGFGGGGTGSGRTGSGTTGSGTTGSGTTGSRATGTGASATGTVTSVSKVATASSGVAGYPVVISFNADANAFYAGATVTGAIATDAKDNVIQVPTRAISTVNGKSTVTVATNGTLGGSTETRAVVTGITAGGQTEITSGLKVGEKVVITIPSIFAGAGGRTSTGGVPTGRFPAGTRTGGGGG